MKLKVDINAWRRKTEAQKKRVQEAAAVFVRKKVVVVYRDVLKVSPQFSGNYVYNWQVEVRRQEAGKYDKKFKDEDWKKRPNAARKREGHPEAVRVSMGTLEDTLPLIKYNSAIRLVNYSPVAPLIEAGQADIDPNRNPTLAHKSMTAYLKQQYKYLDVK